MFNCKLISNDDNDNDNNNNYNIDDHNKNNVYHKTVILLFVAGLFVTHLAAQLSLETMVFGKAELSLSQWMVQP